MTDTETRPTAEQVARFLDALKTATFETALTLDKQPAARID